MAPSTSTVNLRKLKTNCTIANVLEAGSNIFGRPDGNGTSVVAVQNNSLSKGWLLVLEGYGEFTFTLYAGEKLDQKVGTAIVYVGNCDDKVNNYSSVTWMMSDEIGACVTRNATDIRVHIKAAPPVNSFQAKCCYEKQDCFVSIETSIEKIECGKCNEANMSFYQKLSY